MRSGRKSAAQTPAPKKDRIYGSKTNPKGSASSEKSAKSIVLSDKTMKSLQDKLTEFKEKHPAKKTITLNDLKAVYRRGLGAYSSSHRPTITGGVPNTRNAWAMARVNKFLIKAGGTKVKAAYVQDDDLMKYKDGGSVQKLSFIDDIRCEMGGEILEYPSGSVWINLTNEKNEYVGDIDIKYDKIEELFYAPYKVRGMKRKEYFSNPQYKVLIDDLKKYGLNSKDKVHYIEQIYIESDYRGRGYASEALKDLIKYFKEEGDNYLLLAVGADTSEKGALSNKKLKEFYKRHGFVELKGRGNYENRMIINLKDVKLQDDDLMKYKEDGGELDNYSVAIKENGLQQPFEWNAYNSEETIYVPENEIYAFLYDAPNTQDKIDNDALIFSNNKGLGNFWEDLKTQKGSESLVAILKGRLSEDKLYILTMTTKNEFRKKGLMSKLIREVRSKYNIDKENVIFIGLTDMGQKMYKKKRYAEGGLIAPNGKPSNLTPEQYKLVRTPEFKAWFGDWENSPETSSKVVDENGEPKVVYHGTDKEFYKFDKSKGKGSIKQKSINFSSKKEVSKDYGSRILECFLNIRNPYIKNYNGDSYWNIEFNARYEKKFDEIPDQIVNKSFDEKIYDGVIFINIKDSKSRYSQNVLVGNNYYAFKNNQIKLADGTNTTFDANNPDIRFADGGELKEIKLPDLNMSYGALKKTLNYQGYDIEPMKQELQIGKVAKGMSVQQIAQHHNTTVDEIQKQLDKGIQVEMEHTDNQYIARAIALDHVYESPVYYDKLETIEKEFKDGGVVVGKRHSEYDENGSGEKFLVESTGQVVELEGGEGVLCQESMSSDKRFSFEGKSMTGREIASYLNHKYGGVEFAKGGEVKKIDKIKADMPHVCGCKHQYYHGGEVPTAVVRNLKGGEAVVTVKSMESKDQYNFNGKPMNPRQIFSQINMASGGKKFEDGGVINLQSIKDDARLDFDIQLAKMMYYVTTLKQMI
jgi:GNAT superfamily N-acetyltransferase